MTEQLLNRPDVVTILQQVRRERVAEGVAARRLRDARPADRVLDRALQDGLVEVVPSVLPGHAIDIPSTNGPSSFKVVDLSPTEPMSLTSTAGQPDW